jgi:hypothetical protein
LGEFLVVGEFDLEGIIFQFGEDFDEYDENPH